MLLRHVIPNNGAPPEFDTITHACETLDILLAGVKGRCSPCHDSAAIMDARLEKTWLLPVNGGCLYILVVTKYNHVRLIRRDLEDVMKAKGELVKAAKKLMWERGYEATSPRDLLEESGAGQGSLYHHFKGKMDLASVALGAVSDAMCEVARETVGTEQAFDRLPGYLDYLATAWGLRGGQTTANRPSPALRKPVERYSANPEYPQSLRSLATAKCERRGQRACADAHYRSKGGSSLEGLSRSNAIITQRMLLRSIAATSLRGRGSLAQLPFDCFSITVRL
jgi:AcrR family transcriptional regulator